ncbi:MAG: glycosyltransferase [Parachlamydiaceae bacterium]|nr:glycosyltransferase [Parachlamydiaceae bacterium]
MKHSIGIVIPTFQGIKHLSKSLPILLKSPIKPRILIVDSSSTDGTAEYAASLGVEVISILQKDFNHGTTRELGRHHLKTSIVVMMTQDAYPKENTIEHLISPLVKGEASIAYARQIPHEDADIFASFSREFNYADEGHIRSIQEVNHYGVYTFFCSNSCAAYMNSALDEVGGFPAVLFGEDTFCVAKLLHRHHRIAYVAEAEVYHSHNYSLKNEFQRHFDMGLARKDLEKLMQGSGGDGKRGKQFVKQLLLVLWEKNPKLIPYALLQTFSKFSGYHLGKKGHLFPRWFKRFCSSQKFYWNL